MRLPSLLSVLLLLSLPSGRCTVLPPRVPGRAGAPRMAVSKGELVDAIAARAGVSKKMAATVLSSALDVIVESVANGDKVSLVGFGTFDSKERAARQGRNPQTGDKMEIAATVVPTFSFGKGFKDACKKSYTESLKGSQLNGQEAPK